MWRTHSRMMIFELRRFLQRPTLARKAFLEEQRRKHGAECVQLDGAKGSQTAVPPAVAMERQGAPAD